MDRCHLFSDGHEKQVRYYQNQITEKHHKYQLVGFRNGKQIATDDHIEDATEHEKRNKGAYRAHNGLHHNI